MAIRLKEWTARLAEISANFLVPGLGGLIFDPLHKKNALWQMVLSISGMVLAGGGSSLFLSVFIDSSGVRLDEEYVSEVLKRPEEIYSILLGLAGVIFGGILVLGGFLWSLDNAMRRWRNTKPETEEPVELSRQP